jgi:MFS family permease
VNRSRSRWALRTFVAGQGVNAVGSMVSSLALPLVAVYRLHATTLVVGTLEAVEWLPAVLIGLPVGALLDRHQPRARTVMMAANLGQAGAVAAVPAAAALGLLSVSVLVAAAATAGMFTVWFQAGYNPYLRTLADRDDYLTATSRTRGAHSVATLTGPALAGALVETVGAATTVLADAASFLLCFVSLAVLPAAHPTPTSEPAAPLTTQIREGLAYLWNNRLLRTLAWAAASINLFLAAIGAIEIVFLARDLHTPAGWIGVLIALGGLGGLGGSLLATRLSRRFGLPHLARTTVIATAPLALLLPLTSPGPGLLLFALAGPPTSLGIAVVSISFSTLRLQHCPPHLLARVSTTTRTLTATTIPAGALIGGALGQLLTNRTALLALTIGYLTLGSLLLATPSLKNLPSPHQPDRAGPQPTKAHNAADPTVPRTNTRRP